MAISKVGQRRQVVIPREICQQLGINEGDFVEVTQARGAVVIKPKRLVDADDILTPEEEAIVREGEEQIKRGQVLDWEEVKEELKL